MQDPKSRQKSPSGHHRTTSSGYIFATKARIDNRKKSFNSNISSTCPQNMVNFGPLTAENGWRVWGTAANFNRFRMLASLLHQRRSTDGGESNFARFLAVSWAGTLYIHFRALAPNGILPGAKFTLRPSLAFSYIGSVTARHSSSGRQPNFAALYKEWNYGTFAPRYFQQRASPIFRGQPSRWASAHIVVPRVVCLCDVGILWLKV